MLDKDLIVNEMIRQGARADIAADMVTNLLLDVSLGNADCLPDYLKWRSSVDGSRHEPREILDREFGALTQIVEANESPVDENFAEILAESRKMLTRGECKSESFVDRDSEEAQLARDYLHLLLEGDRRQAAELILAAVRDGMQIRDVYVYVLQPVLWEVGRLWQTNQLRVGQEHFCTAATQMVMTQLYPQIFSTPRNGQTIVATTVVGNLHEVGIRMVADLCELEGWDTYYLGASTPIESVLQVLIDRTPAALCVSAALSHQLQDVRELIMAVRQHSTFDSIRIIVGGYCFLRQDDLWRELGADGCGQDAIEAIQLIQQLTGV